jgi:hypothetical protein
MRFCYWFEEYYIGQWLTALFGYLMVLSQTPLGVIK